MRRWALWLAVWGVSASAQPSGDSRSSGFEFMGASTQAMQRDDTLNPAMLWVLEGEQLWNRPPEAAGRSCAGCHGDARVSMRGVAARHPDFDSALHRPVDLRQRIGACRQRQQPGLPPPAEEQAQLSLEAYVGLQSRGLPLAPPQDPRLEPYRKRGRALFEQRFGQLDLSCADCHDQQAGRRLGGSPIPQGHATGYPIYRLEWQGLGSLQRRLRACMSGVRAEPFTWNAPEWVELELFLAWRAGGMAVETPAVRP